MTRLSRMSVFLRAVSNSVGYDGGSFLSNRNQFSPAPARFRRGHSAGSRCLSKLASLFLLLLVVACGGSLSEDQRKKLHEGMEDNKITHVTDDEIVTAAMDEGRLIFGALEKSGFEASERLARERKVKVRYIKPGTGDALEIENQIIQAYIVGSVTGATQDNIQKLRAGTTTGLQDYDTLLYSRPILTPQPDGSVNVEGVWNIYIAKREVVRNISRK